MELVLALVARRDERMTARGVDFFKKEPVLLNLITCDQNRVSVPNVLTNF